MPCRVGRHGYANKATTVREKLMPSILITGASRGLGLEMVRQYGGAGWRVLACCRAPSSADALNELAAEVGGALTVHQLDVLKPAEITALAEALSDTPIDVLCNNAGSLGVSIDAMGPSNFGSIDYQMWRDVLEINTLAPTRVAEAFVEHVARSELKLMVFISTRMGSIGALEETGLYQYRSSKTALNLVVKAIAIDLKDRGIRTLAVHPGWVRTDMGGAEAPVGIEESITGVRAVIDETIGNDETAQFYQFDGTPLPW